MATLSQPCQIDRSENGTELTFTLSGCIDERADLSPLLATGNAKSLVLDLFAVERINSVGVRDWIETMRQISSDLAVYWERTSVPMMYQVTMIANFHGHSQIRSFMGPYYCAQCDLEHPVLLQVDSTLTTPPYAAPPADCPECGQSMEFDEMEEDFFEGLAAL